MKVQSMMFKGRRAWEMDNDALSLTMTQGGGHIAALSLRKGARTNPLWVPIWKTIEPWQYTEKLKERYDCKLLASICGHNLCLGWFGTPSEDEQKAGMGTHGEAPVVRWKLLKKAATKNGVSLTCGCELPVAGMRFVRTVSSRKGSAVISVREQVFNIERRDTPFTICQHVTLGPPFMEKGVTVFDMPATKCHTFPDKFDEPQRLKPNTAFTWPDGPGMTGKKVNMRMIGKEHKVSSDFSAHLINPARSDGWFSAVNPRLGLLLAYVWKRTDFPWVANWEENYGRKENPWAGKSLTRGMEFSNTPFPSGLRKAVTMGTFQGQPTYRWLPARGKADIEYSIILMEVTKKTTGVADIRESKEGFSMDLL